MRDQDLLFYIVKERRNLILKIGRKHGIDNIRVFGSVARLEDKPDSDLDLLVEIEKGRSLFDLIRFKHELEDLLGVSVDVVTVKSIHWSIRQVIFAEAIQL